MNQFLDSEKKREEPKQSINLETKKFQNRKRKKQK